MQRWTHQLQRFGLVWLVLMLGGGALGAMEGPTAFIIVSLVCALIAGAALIFIPE